MTFRSNLGMGDNRLSLFNGTRSTLELSILSILSSPLRPALMMDKTSGNSWLTSITVFSSTIPTLILFSFW